MKRSKRIIILGCMAAAVLFCMGGCAKKQPENEKKTETDADEWTEAKTTPLGKYPELVTYTLGKVTAENNSNMPDGDTYENNNYTRYIRELLNVQNEDIIEGQDHSQYERLEIMAVMEGKIPDIMVVTDNDILDTLVEHDLIQDLTSVYETCTSDRIKEMYSSYGGDQLEAVTYDGKLMAFPEAEIYTGPNLLWLRKDWIDKLGLEEPQTLDEAMEIVRQFTIQNPGEHEDGNVGLVFDPSMVGKSDQCFSLCSIFDAYHAYPGKWIKDDDGNMVYGSVTEEMKNVLEKLHEYYQNGVLDQNFMMRNAKNLPELLQNGQSGAFFGWWWAPNNPLSAIYDGESEWKPYLFTDEEQKVETSISYGRHYCVVARKGFEHPEIIPKVLTALFDYARYDGKEEAECVGQYLGMNIDPTATPFVINIDYSDAIFRVTNGIQEVLNGNKKYSDLTVLEQGYYNSCVDYLEKRENAEGWQWAAYASRITAVGRLAEADITYVNKGYTQEFAQVMDKELSKMATKAFITIITGENPVEYFDIFVKEWYEAGGQKMIDEANWIVKNK